jgi:hypothetical protein
VYTIECHAIRLSLPSFNIQHLYFFHSQLTSIWNISLLKMKQSKESILPLHVYPSIYTWCHIFYVLVQHKRTYSYLRSTLLVNEFILLVDSLSKELLIDLMDIQICLRNVFKWKKKISGFRSEWFNTGKNILGRRK